MLSRRLIAASAAIVLLGAGCGSSQAPDFRASTNTSEAPALTGPLTLTSSAFQNDQPIPEKYTCKGQDFSPPIAFANVPSDTISLAVTMRDLDAPFDHWVMFNISPGTQGIAEGDIPPGTSGSSSGGRLGYEGPCPQNGSHKYEFKLYALKRAIYLQDGATREELEKEMEGKILQTATLTGTFGQ